MTSQKAHWQLLHQECPSNTQELQRWLLVERGITDFDQFISPPHPLELIPKSLDIHPTQLKKTVQRLVTAKANNETVVIAGDYDADGICATAVLWLACQAIGLKAQPFIPNRHKHGYGLNQRSIPDLIGQNKPDLIITVDNGIVAHDAINSLVKMDIDVIITDHHEKTLTDPPALAIVHTTQLCGAGVAWMLAKQLLMTEAPKTAENQANLLIDLVAIATIADQVPLLDANRSFAYHGLHQLRQTTRPGLQALFELASIDQSKIDEWSISYQLAPRLNALGRLTHGMEALRLLCGVTKHFAQKRARLLEQANQERQEITHDLYERAQQLVLDQTNEPIIVIAGSEFHEGIIGLLAGRLVEQYGKPAIVISVSENLAKGSVRSVAGFHITDFLRSMPKLFLELGGHAMAAGFAVEPSQLTNVISKIQETAQKKQVNFASKAQLSLVCPLTAQWITLETIATLEQFAPFGQGNPRPLFLLADWKIVSLKQIGSDGKHLKLIITTEEISLKQNITLEAIWWKRGDLAQKLSQGDQISLAGRLEKQTWKSKAYTQLVVVDANSLDANF